MYFRSTIFTLALLSSGVAFADAVVDDATPAVSPENSGPVTQEFVRGNGGQLNIEQRVARIEQQVVEEFALLKRIDDLQQEVTRLSGELEVQTHQLQVLQGQKAGANPQQVASNDTIAKNAPDADVDSISGTKPVLANTAEKTSDTAESTVFGQAFTFIRDQQYSKGVDALNQYLKVYPQGQFAANAHYWLGEVYLVQGNNDKASAEFSMVVNNYPDSSKGANALFKLGTIYSDKGQWQLAKAAYTQLRQKFPNSTEGQLAQERIQKIKDSGL